jgi:hypothetical protein
VKHPHGDGKRTVATHLPEDSGGALARTGRRLRPGSGVVSFGHGRQRSQDGGTVGTRRGEARRRWQRAASSDNSRSGGF